jgi:hypothetical protein
MHTNEMYYCLSLLQVNTSLSEVVLVQDVLYYSEEL